MAAIAELAYVSVGTHDITSWREFATTLLGVEVANESPSELYLRMDEAVYRIHVQQGQPDDLLAFGFSVANQSALESLASQLSAHGIAVTSGSVDEVRKRRVAGMIICSDPNGIRVEVVHGLAKDPKPFVLPRSTDGFVTGERGMGHAVIIVDDLVRSHAFYSDAIGMRITDWVEAGPMLKVAFYHCNRRHHTVALVPAHGKASKRLNHIQLQLRSMDDVGRCYDAAEQSDLVLMTLGKHRNDEATSFYMRTPSGFGMELAWGGVEVDDSKWQPQIHHEPSIWGHHFRGLEKLGIES